MTEMITCKRCLKRKAENDRMARNGVKACITEKKTYSKHLYGR